jgi:hypothetical protein
MSDEQTQADALAAVRSAITDANGTELLKILQAESHTKVDEVAPRAEAGWLQSGVRLLRALDQLSDAQRDALLLAATLPDQKRQVLFDMLNVMGQSQESL